jgi:hypothetical protein
VNFGVVSKESTLSKEEEKEVKEVGDRWDNTKCPAGAQWQS